MKQPIALHQTDNEKRLSIPPDLNSHLITHAYLYLQPNGWFHDSPEDQEGVTPWFTFPAIAFLKDVLSKDTKVFEFGCGFSTIFFNNYVGEVVSIEHNLDWMNKVKTHVPNANIICVDQNAVIHPNAVDKVEEFKLNFKQYRTNDRDHDVRHGLLNDEFAGYASAIFNYPKGYFDVIILDGMARSLTGVLSIEMAREDTLIILDNSDRCQYNNLQLYLNEKGFQRLDFWGPGWNNYNAWCTSIFCRNFKLKNNRLLRPETEGPIFV
jgi:hypothetical protein